MINREQFLATLAGLAAGIPLAGKLFRKKKTLIATDYLDVADLIVSPPGPDGEYIMRMARMSKCEIENGNFPPCIVGPEPDKDLIPLKFRKGSLG